MTRCIILAVWASHKGKLQKLLFHQGDWSSNFREIVGCVACDLSHELNPIHFRNYSIQLMSSIRTINALILLLLGIRQARHFCFKHSKHFYFVSVFHGLPLYFINPSKPAWKCCCALGCSLLDMVERKTSPTVSK